MKMIRIGLNAEEKDCIKKISKRLADSQRGFLKAQDECLEQLAAVLGYEHPKDARQCLEDELLERDDGGKVMIFDDPAAWALALTEVCENDLLDCAEQEIKEKREKLGTK